MKKFLALILILSILAMMFVACNNGNTPSGNNTGTEATQPTGTTQATEKNSETNTQDATTYKVSREEWKNAFDFSTYGNFVYTFDEMLSEGDNVWLANGTVKSQNGTLYRNINYSENEKKESIVDTREETFSLELNALLLPTLMGELNKSASLGYTMFNYKEDTKSYYSKMDADGTPCDINIWFEDGKIVKLTCKGYTKYQEMDGTYYFSFN